MHAVWLENKKNKKYRIDYGTYQRSCPLNVMFAMYEAEVSPAANELGSQKSLEQNPLASALSDQYDRSTCLQSVLNTRRSCWWASTLLGARYVPTVYEVRHLLETCIKHIENKHLANTTVLDYIWFTWHMVLHERNAIRSMHRPTSTQGIHITLYSASLVQFIWTHASDIIINKA